MDICINMNWDTNNCIQTAEAPFVFLFLIFNKGQESWLEAGETADFQQTEVILALKSEGLAKWWEVDNDNTRL